MNISLFFVFSLSLFIIYCWFFVEKNAFGADVQYWCRLWSRCHVFGFFNFFRLHQRQKTKKRLSFLIHSDSILFDSFENAIYEQRFSSFPPIYQHFSSEIHNNIKRNDLSLKCHDRYVDVRTKNAMGISCNHLFKLFVRLICFDYWIERLLNKRNPCCFLNIFYVGKKAHTHTHLIEILWK